MYDTDDIGYSVEVNGREILYTRDYIEAEQTVMDWPYRNDEGRVNIIAIREV